MWLENGRQERSELSLDEIEKVLHNISKASGVMGVTFTGGEPLLRSDLHEIVRMCRKFDMKAALATNGTLLTDKLVNSLIESGIEHFDIGFSEPATKTRLALASAAKSGCTVTASICIHKNNYERTGILCELAAVLGADAVALNRFVPTGRGKHHSQELQLSNEDLLTALKYADRAAAAAGIYIYTGIPVEPCIASSTEFPGIVFSTCQCGESKWAIDPSGNLRTCEQNREILGNLLENSFTEILGSSSVEIGEFRDWRRFDHCFSCKLPGNCTGGCRFR
ncbi:MAG: radical SAM protein [Candidatus Sabulitectum sp.]|nr:radical SAM protein [Candidatus Sabulitectum sp.]